MSSLIFTHYIGFLPQTPPDLPRHTLGEPAARHRRPDARASGPAARGATRCSARRHMAPVTGVVGGIR